MQLDRTGLAEAGRLERALFAFGRARDRFAARLRSLAPKPVLPRRLRRPAQLLGWALTLRLPGELGYWLRARRSRGCAPRGFSLPASPEPVVSVIIPTLYGALGVKEFS